MVVTASKLRENVYRLLDEVIETGVPLEIERKGVLLKVVTNKKPSKLENLIRNDVIAGNPDDLVHMDWSSEWNPDPL